MTRAPAHVLAQPPPAGRSAARTRAFLAACVYRRRGWIPIPVGGGDGKKALVPWGDLREDPPTLERLVEWWQMYPDAGVALLTGGGIVVFDVDGPSAEAYLAQQGGIPEGAAVATTPSGRRHVFFKGDLPTARPRGIEACVKGHGGIVVVPPGPGRVWEVPPKGELEPAPQWLHDLATHTAPHRRNGDAGPMVALTEEELSPWREIVRDLRPTKDGAAEGCCPLHDDRKPSFRIFRDRGGYVKGYCWVECENSLTVIGKDAHGKPRVACSMTLNRLRAKVAQRVGVERFEYGALRRGLQDLKLPRRVEAIALAHVSIAQERRLDPWGEVGSGYRVLAKHTGLERVLSGGSLSSGGRTIWRALGEFDAYGGVVKIGTQHEPATGEGELAKRGRPTQTGLGKLAEALAAAGITRTSTLIPLTPEAGRGRHLSPGTKAQVSSSSRGSQMSHTPGQSSVAVFSGVREVQEAPKGAGLVADGVSVRNNG